MLAGLAFLLQFWLLVWLLGTWISGSKILKKRFQNQNPESNLGASCWLKPDLQPEPKLAPKPIFIQVLLVTNLSYIILYDIFSNWA